MIQFLIKFNQFNLVSEILHGGHNLSRAKMKCRIKNDEFGFGYLSISFNLISLIF